MNEIITLTICLLLYLSKTQLKQLHHIIFALLCMTGRVTMLGLSRWTEGRFYSSIAGQPIASLSFLALSLIDVGQRRSYPLAIAQHLPVPKATKTTEGITPGVKRDADDQAGVKIMPKPHLP